MSWFGYRPFISFSRFNSRRCVEPQIGQSFTEHTHSISCLLWKHKGSQHLWSQTLSASFTRYTTSPEFSWLHISGSHVVHRADCRCSVYGIRYTVQHTVILAPYWLQLNRVLHWNRPLVTASYYLTSRVPRPHVRSLAIVVGVGANMYRFRCEKHETLHLTTNILKILTTNNNIVQAWLHTKFRHWEIEQSRVLLLLLSTSKHCPLPNGKWAVFVVLPLNLLCPSRLQH